MEGNLLKAWQSCLYCPSSSRSNFSIGYSAGAVFRTPLDFMDHLRRVHCTKEGGSFVCKYGPHNVCLTLPLEGVADRDYVEHVRKVHIGDLFEQRNDTKSVVFDKPNLVMEDLHSQNLSSILNDPRKTRRETMAFFTRHWGESFVERTEIPPCPHLPKITMQTFEHYLNTIAKNYRHLKKAEQKLKKRSREFAPDGTSDLLETSEDDRVPQIFFSLKFSLEDPQYFEALFADESFVLDGRSVMPDVQQHGSLPKASNISKWKPSKLLLEKLTHYLDMVEIEIAKQVAEQSSSFFEAMTSHDQLQQQLQHTKLCVQNLRSKMSNLNHTLAVRPLRLVRLKDSRTNCENVLAKMELMATIRQTQATVQALLNSSDYLGALELIATTQAVLSEELKNVVCFRHLSTQLDELECVISKMLQEDFVKFIKMELSKPLCTDEAITLDEVQLVSLILGLLRVQEFRFFFVLKEEIGNAIKNLVREVIRDVVSGADNDANEGTLADQMRKLDFDTWYNLMESLFARMMLFISKIKLTCDILSDVFDLTARKCQKSIEDIDNEFDKRLGNVENEEADGKTGTSSQSPVVACEYFDVTISEIDHQTLDEHLDKILPQTCTTAQDRLTRVLNARGKDGFLERLSIDEYLRLSTIITDFIGRCDSMSNGKKIGVLRSCLQSYSTKLVQRFHDDKKQKLSNILDSENWKQADIPSLFQEIVDHWSTTGKFYDVPVTAALKSRLPQPKLIVNGETFVVVGTALLLLQTMAQYCQLVDQIPSLAADLLIRLVEVLKNFNSRTCQLILGAGALQLVGLRTISAKNLALAYRCLQLIIYFIRVAQTHFEPHLQAPTQHVTRHLVQVLKDYENHVDELFAQMLTLVENQLVLYFRKWELKPPLPSTSFQQIVKIFKRFHDGVCDVLPSDQLQRLLLRLHDKFKILLKKEMKELKIGPQDASLYGLVCSEYSYYMANLKSLPCCAAVDDSLNHILADQ